MLVSDKQENNAHAHLTSARQTHQGKRMKRGGRKRGCGDSGERRVRHFALEPMSLSASAGGRRPAGEARASPQPRRSCEYKLVQRPRDNGHISHGRQSRRDVGGRWSGNAHVLVTAKRLCPGRRFRTEELGLDGFTIKTIRVIGGTYRTRKKEDAGDRGNVYLMTRAGSMSIECIEGGKANEVKRKDQGRQRNGPITSAAAAAAAKRDTRE